MPEIQVLPEVSRTGFGTASRNTRNANFNSTTEIKVPLIEGKVYKQSLDKYLRRRKIEGSSLLQS